MGRIQYVSIVGVSDPNCGRSKSSDETKEGEMHVRSLQRKDVLRIHDPPPVLARPRLRAARFGGGASDAAAAGPPSPCAAFLFSVALPIAGVPDEVAVGVAGVGAEDVEAVLGPAPCVCNGFGLCCFCGDDGCDEEAGLCCAAPELPGVDAFGAGPPGKRPIGPIGP